MITYNKIIFVCMGNTCRSPMAATIMQSYMKDSGVLIESRGLVVLFAEPYNPKAVAIASAHGMIMPSNNTIQIMNKDFGLDTLVLVMNPTMKQKLYDEYDGAINVYTIGEFAGEFDAIIDDPYGRGVEQYNECFEQLERLLAIAAERILQNMEEKKEKERKLQEEKELQLQAQQQHIKLTSEKENEK